MKSAGGGRPGSLRSFVAFLENEYEICEQSEAAVLEQEAGGVQLMTAHKSKGLEFPVVILAEMTTSAADASVTCGAQNPLKPFGSSLATLSSRRV